LQRVWAGGSLTECQGSVESAGFESLKQWLAENMREGPYHAIGAIIRSEGNMIPGDTIVKPLVGGSSMKCETGEQKAGGGE